MTLGGWCAAQQDAGGKIPPELEGDELPKFVARLQEKLNRIGPLKKSSKTSSPQVGELRHFVQLLEAKLDQVQQLQDGERRERQMEQRMNCMAGRHQAQQEQAEERIQELLVQIQKAQQAFKYVTSCQSEEMNGLREELRVKVEETERLRAELCNLLNTTQAQEAEMEALQEELQEIPRLEAELIAARREIAMMELGQSAFQQETHSLILELMGQLEEPAHVAAVALAAQEVVELQVPPEPTAPAADELPELSSSAELPDAAKPAPASAPTSAADQDPSSPAEEAAPTPELCASVAALEEAPSHAAGVPELPAAPEAATPSPAQQASLAEALPKAPLQGLPPPAEAAPGPAAYEHHGCATATEEASRPSEWQPSPADPLAEAPVLDLPGPGLLDGAAPPAAAATFPADGTPKSATAAPEGPAQAAEDPASSMDASGAEAEKSAASSCLEPPAARASSSELSAFSLKAGSAPELQQTEPPTRKAMRQLSSASHEGCATPPTGMPSEDPSPCPSEEELHTENLLPLAAFAAGASGPPATIAPEAVQGHKEELPAASVALRRQLPPSSEAEEDLRVEHHKSPTPTALLAPRQPAHWWEREEPQPAPGSQSTSITLPAAGAAASSTESAAGPLTSGDDDFFASLGIEPVGGAPQKEATGSSSPPTPVCEEGALTRGDDEDFFASLGLLPGGLGS